MHEDEVEDSDVADKMLGPELIEAKTSGASIGQDGGGYKRKCRSAESPEIADVEKVLILADHHKATEDDRPAANRDGKVIDGIGI